MGTDLGAIESRLQLVRSRIVAAGGDLEKVVVVAVTKGRGAEAVQAALDLGLVDIGENYSAELLAKAAEISALAPEPVAPRWNYLGAIQRNKIRRLAPLVSCWQSVARIEEVVAIAAHAPADGAQVFVEVDVTGLPGRGGCSVSEAPRVVEAARQAGCQVRGLMTVAPLGTHGEMAAEAFGRVAQLAALLGLDELSMGMSDDLEQAVVAGSTMVRIGTALFGERASR